MKSVQIRGYFWSLTSCIRTEYGPEMTPYLDTFYAVNLSKNSMNSPISWRGGGELLMQHALQAMKKSVQLTKYFFSEY